MVVKVRTYRICGKNERSIREKAKLREFDMKRVLIYLAVVAVALTGSLTAHAEPPQTMNYQGYLKDAKGDPVTGAPEITFIIYDAPGEAKPLWSETHREVVVTRGQFNVVLGQSEYLPQPLGLPFDRQYWLGIRVDGDPEMTPRQPLTTSPYAFRATIADSVPGLSITTGGLADGAVIDAKISGTISAAKLDLTGVVKKTGDSMSGPLAVTGTIESTSGGIKFPDGTLQSTAYQIPAKADCSGNRYEDNGDGTVSDCRTGLIWLKNAKCTDTPGGTGAISWNDAVSWAAWLKNGTCGLTDGSSKNDWRIPTKTELMAMIASARKQLFVNPVLTNSTGRAKWAQGDPFDDIQADYYWSSSATADNVTYAWYVNMGDGYVFYAHKVDIYYVWPVRAGQ